jgi:hydroxyacylglutathione hydrolase
MDLSKAISDPKLNMSQFWANLDDIVFKPADIYCCDREMWPWAGSEIRFYATSGRTPGSFCIAAADQAFSGDTLLPGAKRVTKLPSSNRALWQKNIQFIFNHLCPGTIIYPGHGQPFRLRDSHVSSL